MIIRKIHSLLQWEPHNIFHQTRYEWYSYRKPRVEGDLFGIYTSFGDHYEIKDHTKLGGFFLKLPLLIEVVLKTVYYVIAWPLYLCVKIPWSIFTGIFIPQKWLD